MQDSKELIIFRQINEGRLGSNQQLHREEGFYAYMKEHHPDLKMWELNLYAKQRGEDSILDDFFKSIQVYHMESHSTRKPISLENIY